MTVLLVFKTGFQSGTFTGVKNIAYDPGTQIYTITKSDNTTVTYSGTQYYLVLLWN